MISEQSLTDADNLFRAGKYTEALELYRQAAQSAVADNNTETRIEALAQVARMYSATGKLEEGKLWLERAQEIASQAYPKGWSRYLGVRGIFERESREQDKAVATFKEMYEYCCTHKLHSRAVDAAHHIAIAGTTEQKIEWGLKGIEQAEAGGMKGWLAPLWNNLGNTYDEAGRFPEALDAFLKAREFHTAAGNPNTHIGDWAVAKAYRKVGNIKLARENLTKAQSAVKQRLQKNPGGEDREWAGWCAWEDGELLILEGKNAQGIAQLKRGLAELIAVGLKTWGPYFADMAAQMESRVSELER